MNKMLRFCALILCFLTAFTAFGQVKNPRHKVVKKKHVGVKPYSSLFRQRPAGEFADWNKSHAEITAFYSSKNKVSGTWWLEHLRRPADGGMNCRRKLEYLHYKFMHTTSDTKLQKLKHIRNQIVTFVRWKLSLQFTAHKIGEYDFRLGSWIHQIRKERRFHENAKDTWVKPLPYAMFGPDLYVSPYAPVKK
jgi:hypothetical protein